MHTKYLVMWNDSWMRPEQILNLPKLLAEFDAENHLDSNGNNVEVVSEWSVIVSRR